jgi:malate dehydrogenase
MSKVAILGAGPIGSAVAQRLAQRARVHDVILVDAQVNVASGKALDLQQSGPIEHFDTRVTAAADPLAAVGADVIVLADDVGSGDWEGERGLALVRQLVRAGAAAPIVFAGPAQAGLMEGCVRDANVSPRRLVGTAPSAVVGAVKVLAAIELNLSTVELTVTGRPPAFVVGWSAATCAGSLLTDRVPAHRLLAISDAVKRLWPPGPQAIGAATAPVVEALVAGSRRLHPALSVLEGELGLRGSAVMLPLELGHGRVLARVVPSLSPQERTDVVKSVSER